MIQILFCLSSSIYNFGIQTKEWHLIIITEIYLDPTHIFVYSDSMFVLGD